VLTVDLVVEESEVSTLKLERGLKDPLLKRGVEGVRGKQQ
jgi:hypothetical protein